MAYYPLINLYLIFKTNPPMLTGKDSHINERMIAGVYIFSTRLKHNLAGIISVVHKLKLLCKKYYSRGAKNTRDKPIHDNMLQPKHLRT
jgi:hypothetical protein